MTKTQATDIHATQQGAPLCTHLTQELEYLTLSEEGELTGTYHCCACGKAMDRIYKVRPSSTDPYHAISIDASYSCHRSALLSIFANQKVVNSDHLSGEPVSYKLQKSMGCSDF
jgi:hypothetical protein